jgi:hypothetical protein
MVLITNDSSGMLGNSEGYPAGNGFSYYIIFTNLEAGKIREDLLNLKKNQFELKEGIPIKTVTELVGKLKGTLVHLGPDALELMDSQTKPQKDRSENETPESRDANKKEPADFDLLGMGITRQEFDQLNTAFTDPARLANIIKKLASVKSP